MKGRQIKYTEVELAWIKSHCKLPRAKAHAKFCKKFGRTDVSRDNYKSLCNRNGWLTGRTGQFDPGQVPANKGKKMPFNENSAKTQFKKGQVSHTYRGPGHERICKKDGYVILIVAETNPWTGAATRPVLKHRWLWEKLNGPLPKGHCLKSIDGDKTNTDPANWVAVPRALLPRLSGGRWYKPYEAYDPEVRPVVLTIAMLDHAARTAVKAETL